MDKWMKRALKRARHYSVIDFAVLKISLLSMGVLIGVHFKDFFKKHMNKIWLLAAASFGAIMYRTIGPKAKKK